MDQIDKAIAVLDGLGAVGYSRCRCGAVTEMVWVGMELYECNECTPGNETWVPARQGHQEAFADSDFVLSKTVKRRWPQTRFRVNLSVPHARAVTRRPFDQGSDAQGAQDPGR